MGIMVGPENADYELTKNCKRTFTGTDIVKLISYHLICLYKLHLNVNILTIIGIILYLRHEYSFAVF